MREGWKEYKLGEVAFFQRGHDLPKVKMHNGNIPVAGSNGIIGYHDAATTKGPGITIGRSGNIGTPKFYQTDFWAHNTVLYVKEFHGNDEKFLFYFLHTLDLVGLNAGSAVPTLNRNHIHEISFFLPPLPEQRAIASVLSSLDDKIDLLHRENKTLESMAETLFRQWFVEEAEEDWEEKRLGELCSLITDGKHGDCKDEELSGYYFISVKDIKDGEIDYSDARQITKSDFEETHRRTNFAPGDTLITNSGTIGRMAIAANTPETYRTTFQKSVAIVKPKNDVTSSYYLYCLLKSNIKMIINLAGGTTQSNLLLGDLREFEVKYPGYELVNKFEQHIRMLFDKYFLNHSQIRTLSALRDTLLPKLMSGEVRVSL